MARLQRPVTTWISGEAGGRAAGRRWPSAVEVAAEPYRLDTYPYRLEKIRLNRPMGTGRARDRAGGRLVGRGGGGGCDRLPHSHRSAVRLFPDPDQVSRARNSVRTPRSPAAPVGNFDDHRPGGCRSRSVPAGRRGRTPPGCQNIVHEHQIGTIFGPEQERVGLWLQRLADARDPKEIANPNGQEGQLETVPLEAERHAPQGRFYTARYRQTPIRRCNGWLQ